MSKVYGQTPVLSAFDASALVNGETVGSVTLASAGQVATASVAGSPYPIVPSNATGGTFTPGNYSISYVNGVLTVTPVTVVPPIEPPELVDPEVVPPEVPVVVEPEVVVPPQEPPVEPEVVVPPQEPPVVPEQPVVQPWPEATPEEAPSGTSEKQALPSVPKRDAQPVLLTVSPPGPMVQGPVTQAVAQAPLPIPIPIQTPAPAPMVIPAAPPPLPVVPPAAQEEVKPLEPMPMVSPRRPKQDRN